MPDALPRFECQIIDGIAQRRLSTKTPSLSRYLNAAEQ